MNPPAKKRLLVSPEDWLTHARRKSPGVGQGLYLQKMKKAIEESFPIVEINQLAIPERNAFKPVDKTHKWFARRAAQVADLIVSPIGRHIMGKKPKADWEII